ncbi:MAG: Gar1/Naf1 family protein [Candidatus Nezhaarchaeota archaeon]|nr:Gar1/Naf1 family protein [Candidatus Nezhaarchaeota archaeon]MCX8141971.1 Gar1/Naf1 family protein [Candidatus Nezhaarchaeota archaeon]MDW8050248.1 Gar1/Naf1 family protein [Nitrososphaerota archaeon]
MEGTLTLLGSTLHLSKSNMLIVKAVKNRAPKVGDIVYDGKGRVVGQVYDIIGPASSPYIVIKPSKDLNLHGLLKSKKVYVKPPPQCNRRKRK